MVATGFNCQTIKLILREDLLGKAEPSNSAETTKPKRSPVSQYSCMQTNFNFSGSGRAGRQTEGILAFAMFKICLFSFMPTLKSMEKLFQCTQSTLHTSIPYSQGSLCTTGTQLGLISKNYTYLTESYNNMVMQHS